MRAVIQRVLSGAKVVVNNKTTGSIEQGLFVLLGVEEADEMVDIQWLSKKIINLRIFNDLDAKMNLSVQDIKGSILVVSQFTLFASTKKGNRPSFLKSAKPAKANKLYNQFIEYLRDEYNVNVQTGIFGADMKVELVNDGPVTILIDTKNKE